MLLVTDRQRFGAPDGDEIFAAAEWQVLQAAEHAGVGAIQLREKGLDGRRVFERARRLVELCAGGTTRVLVNDRADIARAANAAGVHLPGAGLAVENARSVVGPGALIGRSVHGREEIAASAGADYLIFGPIFETPSKQRYGAPQGLERLAEFSRASDVPVVAIGGITVERVGDVLACGACGVAVMGAILSSDNPSGSVRAFKEALASR
ncbi:MAG: thiamine phosphate synthase [Candidatus Binatia bacterium]|nr:thiamine phosphate synthase [Candidatus Binatia bacterium]